MSLEEEKKVVEEERREVGNGKGNATCISGAIFLLGAENKGGLGKGEAEEGDGGDKS